LNEANEELKLLRLRVSALEQEKEQKQALLDSQITEREKESPALTSLRMDVSNSAKRIQDLESLLRACQMRAETLESKESILTQKLEESQTSCGKLRLAVEAETRALDEARLRMAEVNDELLALRKEKEKLSENLRSTSIEKEKLQGRLLGLEHVSQGNQQREQQLIQERDREREQARSLETNNRELELRLTRAQAELDQMRTQVAQYRSMDDRQYRGDGNNLEDVAQKAMAGREFTARAGIPSVGMHVTLDSEGNSNQSANIIYGKKMNTEDLQHVIWEQQAELTLLRQKHQRELGEVQDELENAKKFTGKDPWGDEAYAPVDDTHRQRGGTGTEHGRLPSSESSILLEVLQQFLDLHNKRKSSNKDKRSTSSPQRSSRGPRSDPKFWIRKLADEKNFLKDSRDALRKEKDSIRRKQNRLSQKRQEWKADRESLSKRDRSGRGVEAKAALKSAADDLNRQAEALNMRVEAARKSEKWLEARERKVSRLEEILDRERGLASSNRSSDMDFLHSESGSRTPSPSSTATSLLEGVGKELDSDVEIFGAESLGLSSPFSTNDSPIDGNVRGDYMNFRDQIDSDTDRDRRKSWRERERTKTRSPVRNGHRKGQPRGHMNVAPEGMRPENPMFGGGVPMYYSVPAPTQSPQTQNWMYASSPIVPSSWPSAPIAMIPSGPVPSMPSFGMNVRSWSTAGSSSTADLRRELRHISGESGQTKDAYEEHASWLDGLRKEIGKFNSGSQSSGKTSDNGYHLKPSPRVELFDV